jgi:trans-aconitate methyltransferase
MVMANYSLGSDDAEIARLDEQAEFLREPTRMLLAASGIGPGMRVLDLGTGLGHVAAAVADLVGPDGQVVGLDLDPRMLAVAQTRTRHLPQVRFVEGDVTRWRDDQPFDAVVGRLILFHLRDPVAYCVTTSKRFDPTAAWPCSTTTSVVSGQSPATLSPAR